jgi:hypothetical protein
MNSRQSFDAIDHSLDRLRPSVVAAGWSARAIDEARAVLLAVLTQSDYQTAPPAIQSKAEILLSWRYLEYWYFEGAPLSVQIALWVGLETGLLRPPADGLKRIDEFAAFFPRQLAFEAAKRRAEIVGGWIFPGEAELFWETIDATALVAGDVAEIGSWVGRSSIVLAAGLEALSPRKRLHVVDDWCFGGQPNLYPYLSDKRNLRAEFEENTAPWCERIVIREGLFQDVSGKMAKASPSGFSLIFHDAGPHAGRLRARLASDRAIADPRGLSSYSRLRVQEFRRVAWRDRLLDRVAPLYGARYDGRHLRSHQEVPMSQLLASVDPSTSFDISYENYSRFLTFTDKHDQEATALTTELPKWVVPGGTISAVDVGSGSGRLAKTLHRIYSTAVASSR